MSSNPKLSTGSPSPKLRRPTTLEGWVEYGKTQTRQLLVQQGGALYRRELEARLSERYFQPNDSGWNIEPHILTIVIDEMRNADEVEVVTSTARGGRPIDVITYPMVGATLVNSTAASKRSLAAKYLSWATSNQRYPRGLTGPTAERANWNILRETPNIALMNSVSSMEVKGIGKGFKFDGAMDFGGYIVPIDSETGLPSQPITLLGEVKNLREWLYARDVEVWQLIRKALSFSEAFPETRVAPVLVARKVHNQTFQMASQLGFFIVQNETWYVDSSVSIDDANTVRIGLGFSDLNLGDIPSEKHRRRVTKTLVKQAPAVAERWGKTMELPDVISAMKKLTNEKLSNSERTEAMDELQEVMESHGHPGWRLAISRVDD